MIRNTRNRKQMEDMDLVVFTTVLLMADEKEEKEHARKMRKQRTMWVRPLFLDENRFYTTLRFQLEKNDPGLFNNFLRMSVEDFDFLLEKIEPHIAKQNTPMRESICPGERLAIALRFLATGDSYGSLMFLFKRSKSSICHIVSEVCDAIFRCLKCEYLHTPSTEDEWKAVADAFYSKWNFPNCFGAVDGKHVEIVAPLKKRKSVYLAATDFDSFDADGYVTPGNWEQELGSQGRLCPLQPLRSEGRGSDYAKEVREELKTFFMNEGEVAWQYKHLY